MTNTPELSTLAANGSLFTNSQKIPGAYELLIPAFYLEPLKKEIAKLNKKLEGKVSKGIGKLDLIDSEPIKRNTGRQNAFGEFRFVDCFKLTMYLPILPKSDWQLVAILKDDSHVGGEFIATNLVADFNSAGMKITCDHCKENRFRKLGFVIRHQNGDVKTIGSTCIDDFLGMQVEKAIQAFIKFTQDTLWPMARECNGDYNPADGDSRYARFRGMPVDLALAAAVAAYCNNSNWATSKDLFHGIFNALVNPGRRSDEILQDYWTPVQGRIENYKSAYLYFKSDAFRDAIDTSATFGQNIKATFFDQQGQPKTYTTHAGIAGWAMFHHLNKINKPVDATKPVSKHLGNLGDKITVAGTITAVRYVSSDWGSSTLLTVTDAAGNIAKTFLNGNKGDTFKVGEAVTMTGKVKKHEDFKGQLSTMLNYVKL